MRSQWEEGNGVGGEPDLEGPGWGWALTEEGRGKEERPGTGERIGREAGGV